MMVDDLLPLLFMVLIPVAGGFAWRRKARKTACALWVVTACIWLGVLVLNNMGPGKATNDRYNCLNNLRQIDGAVQQWALKYGKKATNTYSFSDPGLLSFLKSSALPVCPGGGQYSPGAMIADQPKCSLAAQGHTF
jgi:hypothetical protein